MKTRRIRVDIDKQVEILQGNKEIGRFMCNYTPKLFEDSNYWLAQVYHTSWDALMPVILKIKQTVYDTNYALFSHKHEKYLRIGNACYDADIDGAWAAVVHWIRLFYNIDEKEKWTSLHYSQEYISVSEHAIQRFKERVIDIPAKQIKKELSNSELLKRYKQGGDGRYEIPSFKNAVVVIRDYTITTVLNKDEDEEDVIFKGRKIA